MKLTNDTQKISYIIGEDIGFSFQREGYEMEVDVLVEGLKDAET